MSDVEERPLEEFISELDIAAEVEWAPENPNMDSDGYPMRHWLVVLKRPGGKSMRVPFSQGMAHTDEPTAADVLDCLASDSASVTNAQDFEEWASDFGYSDDSIRALRTYETCKSQAEELEYFLGSEAFQDLLWNVERL